MSAPRPSSSNASRSVATPTTRAQEIAMTTATTAPTRSSQLQIQTATIKPDPEPMRPICEEYVCRNYFCEGLKLTVISLFVSLIDRKSVV